MFMLYNCCKTEEKYKYKYKVDIKRHPYYVCDSFQIILKDNDMKQIKLYDEYNSIKKIIYINKDTRIDIVSGEFIKGFWDE